MPMSGTMSVPITKPLVFTRVTYSRLMICQSLCMGGFLDKDVVERRLEQFEAADARAGLHRGLQQFLRVGARLELRFDARTEAVDGGNRRMVQERIGAFEFNVRG